VFETLIESKRKADTKKAFGLGFVSLVGHSLVVVLAVIATLTAGQASTGPVVDTTMVFLNQEQKKPEEQPPVLDIPQLKGFQTVVAPTDIPTNIPPINLNEKWDPSQFSGVGVEKGFNLTTDVKVDPGAAFIEAVVDEKPSLVSPPQLDYPDLLRQAGIEGTVLIEVIIDTTGHAEQASLRVVQSSNKAFEISARDAVMKSLYRPGRVRGQAVRVLVQVPINFNIRR